MERKLIMLLTTLSVLILLNKVGADDNCGNRCTSTQICGNEGNCYEKANLIKCYSLTSVSQGHYCLKTQECCDDGCMPAKSVCCRFSSTYCQSNHTCCSFVGCCSPGFFCKGFSCIDDKYSTQKPTTDSPPSTSKPRTTRKVPLKTTTRPVTRYPPRTTRWYENRTQRSSTSYSKSALKPWVYAVIVIVVLVVITFAVVVAILIRRRQNSTLRGQTGGRGLVINTPAQIYGQTNRSNVAKPSIPAQTHKPSPQINVAYITTKPVAPVPVKVNNKNNKVKLFSL